MPFTIPTIHIPIEDVTLDHVLLHEADELRYRVTSIRRAADDRVRLGLERITGERRNITRTAHPLDRVDVVDHEAVDVAAFDAIDLMGGHANREAVCAFLGGGETLDWDQEAEVADSLARLVAEGYLNTDDDPELPGHYHVL